MQITLSSGREIQLVKLTQWTTYYGHLAGLPHKRMNDRIIGEVLEKAREHGPERCAPVLIEPLVEATGRRIQVMDIAEERLPRVSSIGVWDSGPLFGGRAEPYSSAVVVWFQSDFGAPSEVDLLRGIKAMDWEAIAVEWSW